MYMASAQDDEVEDCRGSHVAIPLGESIAQPVTPDGLVLVAEGMYRMLILRRVG